MELSNKVITSMFNHLTKSYSVDEARDILNQKYPEATDYIDSLEVSETSAPVETVEAEKLETAVKAKVAKPAKTVKAKPAKAPKTKAAKPAKAKKDTKVDQARALYEAASDKSRKAMIEVFGKKLGMSKAAASTYYYMVKS